mmetsp:Transcript_36078/g.35054  ORF Transcript_36078/g.35054 Transcript_36078/m.35054 type:complete len:127 (+) Transcript_36078:276-656(+)
MMLAGGIDRNVGCQLNDLYAAEGVLAKGTQKAEERVRPFDKDRSGFVMGDGGALFVVESLESAQKRKATVLCEVVGYDLNSFPGDIHTPNKEGLEIVLHSVLQQAGWGPHNVCHINTSGRAGEKSD